MQDVDDDMDLFRRAAEDYPLNTDSADYNEVLKKLSAEQSEKINKAQSKKINYKSLLLLLLLIPLAWLLNNYSFNISEKRYGKTGDKNETNISKSLSSENSIGNTVTVKPVLIPTIKPSLKNAVKIQNKFKNNSGYNQGKRSRLIVTSNNNNQVVQNESSITDVAETDQLDYKKEDKLLSYDNNSKEEKNIKNGDEKPLSTLLSDGKNEAQKSDTAISNQEKVINKLKKKTPKRKEQGLYAGIIITPDISTIKLQSVKNIGVSFGLLLGYEISKKVSVESGISWDKKFYYSDGKYFNTKKIYIPEHAYIVDVQGLCRMIELPVTLKYSFRQTGKTNFFSAVGFSSYFMKREIYDYTIEKYGQQYPYHSAYKRPSTTLFAVINVSVGYNRTFVKNTTLRVEPCLKIPLKGVGIGSLPIMSTGLNIGITKKLF